VERRVSALAGVFVGGASRRMRGAPKGLLRGPDGVTLVERWRGLLVEIGVDVVLVGQGAAYAGLGIEALADEPAGIGPLGGLVALLQRAGDRPALAFACDMPFVSRALVARLLAAPDDAAIVAPRRDGRWEPLCARYDPRRVLPVAVTRAASDDHSLQRLLSDAGAVELPLEPGEDGELTDWDTAEDVARPPRS
jgi:molybdopterin-guanine dinucleotide biosynthesis protein A